MENNTVVEKTLIAMLSAAGDVCRNHNIPDDERHAIIVPAAIGLAVEECLFETSPIYSDELRDRVRSLLLSSLYFSVDLIKTTMDESL